MSGGGYGQQQQYGQPDGFGSGKGYSLTGSQPWQNMATTNPVGQPSPMEQAFAPTQGMGGPMPSSTDTGMAQDLSGKGWGTPPPMLGPDSAPTPDGIWGGQSGGNMQQPIAAQGILNDAMMRAGGKMGTTVNPLAGMATTNPVYGGGMGGGMGGPMPAGQGGYGDYMNRRNSWIDQLRGYVAPPQAIGGGSWGGDRPPVQGPPATSAPPGGPYPGAPKAGAGGVDHMANLRTLMGQDPRLANEYRLRSGDTINWWQQNQGNVAQGLFGGDQGKMQEWLRGTSPTSSNAAPLSQEEMMRLNSMAGIRGPSWMR